jgi:exopolysaccharide biosynthesis polyprenyl glycosylphosphotransferase
MKNMDWMAMKATQPAENSKPQPRKNTAFDRNPILRVDDIIGLSFREQLRHEINRAQRSGFALSILLITQNQKDARGIKEIYKYVRTHIRETDLLGYVDHQTLGVILPYTDEKGAEKSAQNILKNLVNPKFSIAASTYPDKVFDRLTENVDATPDVLSLILDNSVEHSTFKLRVKRAIDIVGSIIGLVLLSPLMLVTAALIKRDSQGDIIFKQTRIGEKGVPFDFYKFRSMYANNDDQIHREYVLKLIDGENSSINQGDAEKPMFKIKSDPRVTPIGKFIRKTSIDELPQLYNVLKGDMSLVGPRPPLPYEVQRYKSWHLKKILDMKPGITGLWQVEGRGRTAFDEAIRLDVQYFKAWSIWLDIKILFKTVKEVLQCRGAV